jgi:IclR family KDG regulon transcriptional repressor
MREGMTMAANSAQTVEKALQILLLLGEKRMSLTQLCEATGYHKSTVHRLVQTLAAYQFVQRDPHSGTYGIGLKVVELGSMRLNTLELKTEAAPYLRQLALYMGHAVHLGIRDDTEVVYIDKIEPVHTLRMFSEIGKRVPLYSTALGKCLLISLTDQEIARLFKDTAMEQRTARTITTLEGLLEAVARVREDGCAFDEGENEPGIYCVGAPVYDYRGRVIAALSTSVGDPALIHRPETIERVKETARSISGAVGYRE